MYGLHCDMCGRFTSPDGAEGWGRVQTLTTSYDGAPLPLEGETRHVCPVCLSIMTEKFIN